MPTKIIETIDGPVVLIPKELLATSRFKVGDTVNLYARKGVPKVDRPRNHRPLPVASGTRA